MRIQCTGNHWYKLSKLVTSIFFTWAQKPLGTRFSLSRAKLLSEICNFLQPSASTYRLFCDVQWFICAGMRLWALEENYTPSSISYLLYILQPLTIHWWMIWNQVLWMLFSLSDCFIDDSVMWQKIVFLSLNLTHLSYIFHYEGIYFV